MIEACFIVSVLVGAWAAWMLIDWVIRGCPDRFHYE